ncbi:MAG: hypothetical protein ACOYIF_03815 [Acetivibrionales bacterium]|jgi:hypothetical protein
MADELDKKLKQIADMFGVSDTSGLKSIVENITPSGSSSEKENSSSGLSASSEEKIDYSEPPSSPPVGGFDPSFMAKASEMLGMFNNIKDSRITLLNSIQPFLGVQRQQRLGGAIQLLKVINLLSTIAPTFNRNTKG